MRLRQERERAGLSLRQLAALCGVEHSDIARIERGEIDPRLSTLMELAEALDISITIP